MPELPIAFLREPPLMPELPATLPGKLPAPLMPELPATLPGKLPAQHSSIPSSLEEPPVPTRKSPALMTESQIRKPTSAPTREPKALVAHRKIANLRTSHIEPIDRLQISHKGFLKVNHKGVPMGIPTVPSGAKLEPPLRFLLCRNT
jgi:hypothetical protein